MTIYSCFNSYSHIINYKIFLFTLANVTLPQDAVAHNNGDLKSQVRALWHPNGYTGPVRFR